MATPTILATQPIISSRQWTTALAPRTGGGWKFICQSFNYDEDVPTQWVLIDIEEGDVTLQNAKNQIFSQTNFQVPSFNTGIVDNNQVRAPNGRIYFGERADIPSTDNDQLNLCYYDPTDEAIHQMPVVTVPDDQRQVIVFSMQFNHDGSRLFCGSAATTNNIPSVWEINPANGAVTIIANVGTATADAVRYAYYLAKDEAPGAKWLYVAVGQLFWELIAIDLTTNTPTTLLTTTGPGQQFIEFENQAGLGWRANVITNGVQTRYWLADGALSAYPGSGAPPGGARNVTPYTNPLVAPPQIDWSRGIGHFLWRPNGSTGEWTDIEYDVDYKSPIALESLAALADGTVIGNGIQYAGFWNYFKISNVSEWFGNWPSGVSEPIMLAIDSSTVYIAGYPNGALYLYNPNELWAPNGTSSGNPSALGSFGTGVRYPYFLIPCATNNRLYTCGRLERNLLGSGISYYDLSTQTFGGAVSSGALADYIPRGFLVNDALGRLIYTGEVRAGGGASEAKIIVFDLAMTQIASWTIVSGLQNGGLLFPTANPEVVVGITNDSPCLLYRFNFVTGTLLSSVNLGTVVIGGSARRPADGSIWVSIAQDLVRIDPETLEMETIVDLEINTSLFAWRGRDLYMIADTELRYLTVGGPDVANLFQPIPAPAGNGSGAATDFSTFGPVKTIVVSHPTAGSWPESKQPNIVIEINNDDAHAGGWAPLCSFQGTGLQQVVSAARWMRATVSNYPGIGAPVVNVAGDDLGCLFVEFDVPTHEGVGAAVDISGLGNLKTLWVSGDFSGVLILEVSADTAGAYFGTALAMNNPGQKNVSQLAKWARIRRTGVSVAGTPSVAMGAGPSS